MSRLRVCGSGSVVRAGRLRGASAVSVLVLACLTHRADAAAVDDGPFAAEVLDVRPRIFLRNDVFEGLTIQKLRARLADPEASKVVRQKWRARPMGRALLWLVDRQPEDRRRAIDGLKQMDASDGTWSDRGLKLVQLATLFDWLYSELDEPTRQAVIKKIEASADAAVSHVQRGQAPFFYSRTPGALAGLCVAGLALHGVSDRADRYLQVFRELGVNEFFQAYQWVDGAATGATYTLSYTYVDLPSICAAWWSATGHNPADWIREQQGDWLGGIVRFYLWYMRPGFAFTDINDQYRGNWQAHDQFCQGLDLASYVTRSGYGRAWSRRWQGRFGNALYHPEYGHNLIFQDAQLAPQPLVDLPHAELFGRESCGYGFFRSQWPRDDQPDEATHVFFRCGDPMNVHGGLAAGEFQVFKLAPLAARSGRYSNYDSEPDQYHRHCVSTNVVLFTDPADPDDRGDQLSRRGLKTDHRTWDAWQQIRARNQLDVAQITHWDARPGMARCRADLSKAIPASKCQQWIREFLWVGDKHLVVLDVIQTPSPEVVRRWQLHSADRPVMGDHLITITGQLPDLTWANPALQPPHRESRLYCQTLLPQNYQLLVHERGSAEAWDEQGKSLGKAEGNRYHREYGDFVVQLDPGASSTKTAFLHVLTATVDFESPPPQASYRVTGPGQIEVSIEDLKATLVVPSWLAPAK